MADEKALAKALKEGGKKGQDITGIADMGGVKFFCISLEEPGQSRELLAEAMKGMNQEVDPEAGELKVGALAKRIFGA